ncbi:hypothetical protein [Oharaeibacter diazotrophicus]|uniref:DUF2066 domain-containing protein n=1 Tax=Oharaeibacter diazotrophicus TaxID=1920512 RepID=A0A4R6RLH2_9HYPH|nr:hypothetical protein [Oharaeibacter diazotrophicus]TDP87509.1 hypothetical protein EDD54_1405 [Oharaeibacter diazotrophicus]BBE70547.1 hypothetical protein OHA_1_00111 [Pleomorphomonas sp. SM30]GLS77294.1 hypothetical protein GCM10007904_26310 [Oharaeibacter diazotrophicus]
MRRAVLEVLTALLLAGAALASPAAAAPLALGDDAALDRFAAMVQRYADASRVRWVVATPDAATRAVLLKKVADRVGPDLVERVRAEAGAPDAAPAAWIETAAAEPAQDCSWQVTLTDPAAPARDAGPAHLALASGDKLPVSGAATYEIGFSGPLQSTLYAFGETSPGAIRDLAAAPEIAIPVAAGGAETLVLVRARRPVPFLDQIRQSLAARPGDRAELGENRGLAERFAGRSRGIGALIQLMDPNMVVAEAAPKAAPAPDAPAEPQVADADLIETCLYTLTPAVGM